MKLKEENGLKRCALLVGIHAIERVAWKFSQSASHFLSSLRCIYEYDGYEIS
jgi:hypothetical protein